jgi:hypothetical protein
MDRFVISITVLLLVVSVIAKGRDRFEALQREGVRLVEADDLTGSLPYLEKALTEIPDDIFVNQLLGILTMQCLLPPPVAD